MQVLTVISGPPSPRPSVPGCWASAPTLPGQVLSVAWLARCPVPKYHL